MFKTGDRVRVKSNPEFPEKLAGKVGRVFRVVLYTDTDAPKFKDFYQGGVAWIDFDSQRNKGLWGIFAFSELEKV